VIEDSAVPETGPRAGMRGVASDLPVAWQLLQGLLPPQTSWHGCALSADPGLVEALPPAEALAVRQAVASRQREFALGRWCARQALQSMGRPASVIPVGANRVPVWPAGVVGSISHDEGWCIAGVAPADRWAGLGVDTELVARLRLDMATQLCTAWESARWLGDTEAPVRIARLARVFSLKEAAFKVLFPRFGQWIDFHQAEATELPDGEVGRVRLQLRVQVGPWPDLVLEGVQGLAHGRVVSVLAWRAPA